MDLESINDYMKNELVDDALRIRISNYLEYLHKSVNAS
jgi:hypothetical protein